MLSAAIDRVDIVGVVLVIVSLTSHLRTVGPVIRRGRVAMGLRLGWIGVVQMEVLQLPTAELISEAWVPPKRHMSIWVLGLNGRLRVYMTVMVMMAVIG